MHIDTWTKAYEAGVDGGSQIGGTSGLYPSARSLDWLVTMTTVVMDTACRTARRHHALRHPSVDAPGAGKKDHHSQRSLWHPERHVGSYTHCLGEGGDRPERIEGPERRGRVHEVAVAVAVDRLEEVHRRPRP